MNQSPLASTVAQSIDERPLRAIRRVNELAEHNLASLQRHLPACDRTVARQDGDSGDAASDKGLLVPTTPRTGGDIGDKSPHPHFELDEAGRGGRTPGVYWYDVVRDDEDGTSAKYAAPVWVCSPLRVAAMTRDAESSEWGRLLVFPDRDDREHRWTCPQSLHAGNGDELRAVLLREGLIITTNPRGRRMVGEYIQSEHPNVRARCVSRTGWHERRTFVLPRETIGDTEAEPVLFQAASVDGVTLGKGGTLAGWTEHVAAPCAGNSRLVLAVSMGFAAPCLGLVQAEGGGVHLRGSSSTGKTTAQMLAASMFGSPESFKRSWRATGNGLEGVAAMHSDLLLVLDELGELDAREAGKVAYMLANGQGKSRAHRDGSPRATLQWRLLFLSSGELGLSDLVTQSGGKVRAGQEVRVIDLAADADAGLGIFNRVPDGMTSGEFADQLRLAVTTHHGHALPAFAQALVSDPGNARDTLRTLRDAIAKKFVEPNESGQVRRVAGRFALIAAAGEYASALKLTGWQTGEAERAVHTCFRTWLHARGTTANGEPAAMLAQVRAFLSANGEARFTRWDAPEDGARTVNRAGFRKQGNEGPTFYVHPECFRQEVCQGFDPAAVARVLEAAGALEHDHDGRVTKKPRLPDGRSTRMYVITPAIWIDGVASS